MLDNPTYGEATLEEGEGSVSEYVALWVLTGLLALYVAAVSQIPRFLRWWARWNWERQLRRG